jgi:hypothetical protein
MSTVFYTESYPLCATSTVSNATATATLTAGTGRLAYITGFIVNGLGATGASVVAVTVTGILGGTQTYQYSVPAGATTAATPLIITFPLPIPASAISTNIVVSAPAFGAGNTNANVTAFGYTK